MEQFPRPPTIQGVSAAGLVRPIGVLLFVPNVFGLVAGGGSYPEL